MKVLFIKQIDMNGIIKLHIQFLAEGKAYRCECSKERLEALREAQLAAKEKPRYDGHCRIKIYL